MNDVLTQPRTPGHARCICSDNAGPCRHPPQFEVLVAGQWRTFYPVGGCCWSWARDYSYPTRWRGNGWTREFYPTPTRE